jgi:hypothetical protein
MFSQLTASHIMAASQPRMLQSWSLRQSATSAVALNRLFEEVASAGYTVSTTAVVYCSTYTVMCTTCCIRLVP